MAVVGFHFLYYCNGDAVKCWNKSKRILTKKVPSKGRNKLYQIIAKSIYAIRLL